MAIELKESFQVAAPIDNVWDFMMSPEKVVACMPGAGLKETNPDNSFIGTVKLKLGAVSAQYQGKVTYTEMDKANYKVVMLAEGNERGGGTVSCTITTWLAPVGTGTEVRCESSMDLTGKIIQVGRGMVEGVAGQIIGKYIASMKGMLEVPGAAAAAAPGAEGAAAAANAAASPATPAAAAAPTKDVEIDVVSIVFKTLWLGVVNFFKRLFGRG